MYIHFLYIQNMFSICPSKFVPTLSVRMTILFIHIVQYSTTPKKVLTTSKLEISSSIHPTMIKITVSKQLENPIFSLKSGLQKKVKQETKLIICFVFSSVHLANYYILVKNLLPRGIHSCW